MPQSAEIVSCGPLAEIDGPSTAFAGRGIPARIAYWALRILLVAAILDAVTTYISLGTPGIEESNPIGRTVIDGIGLDGAMVVRVLIGIGYFLFLGWVFRTQTNSVLRFAAFAVALETATWWWIVVVNNLVVMAR